MLVYNKSPYNQIQRNRSHSNRQMMTPNQKPAANIKEGNDDFVIEMALPGFEKKDIVIDIDQNELKISSKKEFKTGEDQKTIRSEFHYGPFERQFELPDTVNSDKIEASYKNGILMLMLPKREHAKTKPAREISIA